MISEIDPRLIDHREQWERKPALRVIYEDYHRRILSECQPGNMLEIGAGSGHMKEFAGQRVISLDILMAPWLDLVADAQRLPFRDGTFENIVMLDVLHHLPRPADLFSESVRLLAPGGRLVMLEPAITPGSWPFLHFLHPEVVDLSADPLAPSDVTGTRDPFDSNQAIPTLLFKRTENRRRFERAYPQLELLRTDWLSLFAYPLSGGFRPWTLIPPSIVPVALRFEELLLPILGPLLAFRLLIVARRSSGARPV